MPCLLEPTAGVLVQESGLSSGKSTRSEGQSTSKSTSHVIGELPGRRVLGVFLTVMRSHGLVKAHASRYLPCCKTQHSSSARAGNRRRKEQTCICDPRQLTSISNTIYSVIGQHRSQCRYQQPPEGPRTLNSTMAPQLDWAFPEGF